MQKFNLMLIDDELGDRKEAYKKVLTEEFFNLLEPGSYKKAKESIQDFAVDGFVIDIFLDTGPWRQIGNAYKFLEELSPDLPESAPIYLVSNGWGDQRVTDIISQINRLSKFEILSYLSFNQFINPATASLQSDEAAPLLTKQIYDELLYWHERSPFSAKPDQTLRILLLSDTQYGDPHTDNKAIIDEFYISRKLQPEQDDLKPDFVVISGDVSYSGAPVEYIEAKKRLEEGFIKEIWGNEIDKYRERILLVPGNHDVNLRFSACGSHKWKRPLLDDNNHIIGTGEWEKINTKSADSKDGDSLVDYNDFALEPFRQFAKSLTGSRAWDSSMVKSRVDRRFEKLGIRFFLLNTVTGMSINQPYDAKFDLKSLDEINKDLGSKDDPSKFFNIAISHHGIPHTKLLKDIDDSYPDLQKGVDKPGAYVQNWNKIEQIFHLHQINLWMFGHRHEHKVDYRKINEHNVAIIQSASLKIKPHAENDRLKRGFSLIELERENDQVKTVYVYQYTFDEKGIPSSKPERKTVWKK